MESFSDKDVKVLWGNYTFEHMFSGALGNSGGILCIWDPNSFAQYNHIISDNFIALFRTWKPTKTKMILILDGDSIVMGDFNKVRFVEERIGSVFNSQGASEFNSFINNSGLVDVHLEGYSFTWSHSSASKMSKLDRFLVTEGIISSFPYISAVCLDKHLSDHRPILLRDIVADYGATPFRFFNSWLRLDGFGQMVSSTWSSIVLDDRNEMIRFKKKLQILKKEIRVWVADFKKVQSSRVSDINSKLRGIEVLLGQAKIKWAIEGDENSKFFHGVINRNRSNLAIKGVMVNGEWVDNPTCVKEEFRSHFASRFQAPSSNQCCNSLFVTLISKSNDPKFVSDYRPISLIGSIYKVVTKVLANRLSMVMSDLISDVQSAFLPSRQILDGPFIINELLSCLNSGMASILVNGSPTSEFPFHCGLKQGDPLAHFLFILVMESLHLSFSRVVEAGLFKGIHIGSSLKISHLFYADDAFFIGEWSNINLTCIMQILSCFSLSSGLKINIMKSHLLDVGVPREDVTIAARSLGCLVMSSPFKYLGVMWKHNTLSIGRRLTLLKYVLGSTSIYTMSLYKVPKSILHSMESIRRKFFYGANDDNKKITWVSWSKVLAAKEYGGLGVSSFYALNRGLLFKWVWRFLSKDNSLWSRVISSIYGDQISNMDAFHSSLWKTIIREVAAIKAQRVDLLSHCRIRVGNGSRTKFWTDTWIGDTPLYLCFPRIYALDSAKDCFVVEKLNGSLSDSFRRIVRGGVEEFQLAQLKLLIDTVILSPSEDRWVWDLNNDGDFCVKEVRRMLDDFFLPKSEMATRWVKCVPAKVNVFA
ncbi:RNA-directed DNA polymerase, eukaryota [Tanacetum coccineum]